MTRAVYPLAPGRPRVYKLPDGRWAWECACGSYANREKQQPEYVWESRITHAVAVSLAHWHAVSRHDPLEYAYHLPSHQRSTHA